MNEEVNSFRFCNVNTMQRSSKCKYTVHFSDVFPFTNIQLL